MAWRFILETENEQDMAEKKQILSRAFQKRYPNIAEPKNMSGALEFLIWDALMDIGIDMGRVPVEVKVSVPVTFDELKKMADEAKSQAEELPPILENYDHYAARLEEQRHEREMDSLRWGDQE